MKNSSQQDTYSITLNPCNEIKLDDINTSCTITLGSNYYAYDSMAGACPTSIGTITLDSSVTSDYNIQYEIDFGEEWRTHFPDFKKIEEMCKEYPALEKALENFKTIYEMVKDDYASKPREEDQ